ncbi:MAG: class I SAM-dependent methyltransferase [Vicinamibacterales bacterium]
MAGVCLLCSSNDATTVQVGIRHDATVTILQCNGCGFVYQWPRPSESELREYYSSQYLAEYDQQVDDPEQTYRRIEPESHVRAQRLDALLGSSSDVLEVGCSAGAFLAAVQSRVSTVTGVEPGAAEREWARTRLGINVVGSIEEIGDRQFDLIALFHTLEHLLDPVAALRTLLARLKPGGRIVLEVPNVTDALLALYPVPAFPAFYYQRAHLSYFSIDTLAAAVASAGGTALISGVQRYDLSNHLWWLAKGEPGGQGRYDHVFDQAARDAYANALVKSGHADTLWAVVAASQ